jgi:hypothetical protein
VDRLATELLKGETGVQEREWIGTEFAIVMALFASEKGSCIHPWSDPLDAE